MMKRLTNPNVNVEPMRGALGEYEHAYIPGIKERFLNLILNGPTLNGVNKDLLRSLVRQLYSALKEYEDAEERDDWISVKERLPKNDYGVNYRDRRSYLVLLSPSKRMTVAVYGSGEYDWWVDAHFTRLFGVWRRRAFPAPRPQWRNMTMNEKGKKMVEDARVTADALRKTDRWAREIRGVGRRKQGEYSTHALLTRAADVIEQLTKWITRQDDHAKFLERTISDQAALLRTLNVIACEALGGRELKVELSVLQQDRRVLLVQDDQEQDAIVVCERMPLMQPQEQPSNNG